MVTFNYNQYRSITEFIEQDYSYSIQNIYNEALVGYKIKRGLITADLEIVKYSRTHELSPLLLLSANLRPGLIFKFGKSISKTPFQLTLNYKDFIYRLNDVYTDHEIYSYGITLKDKNFKIDYMMEIDDWGINSNDSSFSALELDSGIKRNMFLNGVFYLSNDRKINWVYFKKFNQTKKLNFNNSSNTSFFKINKFKNDNYVFSLNYQSYYSKYKLNLTYLQQGVDFSLSDKIQSYAVSTDLESFFNSALIILNKDIGELKQNMISIKLEPIKPSILSSYFQLDWLKDRYHINLATTSLTLIGIPLYIDNQDMNIIGKEAINIRMGINASKNDWTLSVSFSQHIPYKVDVIEEIPKEEKEDMYGGGLFSIAITRLLD